MPGLLWHFPFPRARTLAKDLQNTKHMKYSIIVPVYNRPDECDELLASLCQQKPMEGKALPDFEVVIVEDGSQVPCEEVVKRYAEYLNVRYHSKPNSGPGQTRNYGVERATGDYVLILDSDVVLPESYLAAIDAELEACLCEAFGGPDRAHESFTDIQKAINYGMTSFFTTGGIRGGSSPLSGGVRGALDKFFPRSFNMGIRRDVYLQLGGFSKMRFGEDVDFSYRLVESGAKCRLFPTAWVYHKRRANFRQFFKQVHNSGIARINLTKRHPGTLKLVHMLPAAFTVGVVLCLSVCLEAVMFLLKAAVSDGSMAQAMHFVGMRLLILGATPLKLYSLIIFFDSTLRNRSLWVGLLSIIAAFVQLTGYGTGFLRCWWQRCVLGRGEFEAFKKNFYK